MVPILLLPRNIESIVHLGVIIFVWISYHYTVYYIYICIHIYYGETVVGVTSPYLSDNNNQTFIVLKFLYCCYSCKHTQTANSYCIYYFVYALRSKVVNGHKYFIIYLFIRVRISRLTSELGFLTISDGHVVWLAFWLLFTRFTGVPCSRILATVRQVFTGVRRRIPNSNNS